jgi:hypothetical protein
MTTDRNKGGTMKVHPMADLFPMMADDELADLAEDIKANGLVHAIVLDAEGKTLIDGRNRLKACKMAGVEPRFQRLNGEAEAAFIVSANLERRNLSKGQQAMARAFIHPEPERGRGKKDAAKKDAETSSFSYRRVQQARLVLRHSPERARAVLAGTLPLDAALAAVEAERKQASSDEALRATLQAEAGDLLDMVDEGRLSLDEAIQRLDERKADQAKLQLIGEKHSDLIALVEEGRMSVMDACAVHQRRLEEDKAARDGATHLLSNIVQLIGVHGGILSPEEVARRLMEHVDDNLWPADALGKLSATRLDDCSTMLRACAQLWRQREKKK